MWKGDPEPLAWQLLGLGAPSPPPLLPGLCPQCLCILVSSNFPLGGRSLWWQDGFLGRKPSSQRGNSPSEYCDVGTGCPAPTLALAWVQLKVGA